MFPSNPVERSHIDHELVDPTQHWWANAPDWVKRHWISYQNRRDVCGPNSNGHAHPDYGGQRWSSNLEERQRDDAAARWVHHAQLSNSNGTNPESSSNSGLQVSLDNLSET